MKLLAMFVAGALVAATCSLVAADKVVLEGNSQGDFVVIGSFCIPKAESGDSESPEITVKVEKSRKETNQKVLLYTDQNRPKVSRKGLSCEERALLSHHVTLSDGKKLTDGWPVDGGTLKVKVSEARAREWFVAVANCDSKVDAVKPVDLSSYTVSTNRDESCMDIREEPSVVGFVVILVVAVFFILVNAGLTFSFYRASEDYDVVKARFDGFEMRKSRTDSLPSL